MAARQHRLGERHETVWSRNGHDFYAVGPVGKCHISDVTALRVRKNFEYALDSLIPVTLRVCAHMAL